MVNHSVKNKILSSFIWKFMEQFSVQGVQFVISIVLARLLEPDIYGVVAIMMIFITVANAFVQTGFNTALIQKKDVDNLDLSSVLYISLFTALFFYILIYFSAPVIAEFYNQPIIVPLLRVLAFTLFFGAVSSVQRAIVARSMQFKTFFISSLLGSIISGGVGIILAFYGYGIWALVIQHLISNAVIMVILWIILKWKPTLTISLKRVWGLFSYGWKILVATLIDNIYTNSYGLIIGKMYSPEILGIYNRGEQFPKMITSNVVGSISSVMLPALSANQDSREEVKKMVKRSIRLSSYVFFPMIVGLAAIAKPLVQVLLTDKWLPSVPFIQIACLTFILWPIHTTNLEAINALGRSDMFLKLEILKKFFGLLVLFFTYSRGIYFIAFGGVVVSLISSIINSLPNRNLINYGIFEQLRDITPSICLSFIMGVAIYSLQWVIETPVLLLLAQIVMGVIIYIAISSILKIESYVFLRNLIFKKK